MIDNFDVTLVKGDTARWSNFFLGITSGVTFDFVGCTLHMQVRNGYNPSTLVASYTKNFSEAYFAGDFIEPNGFTGGLAVQGGTVYMCLGHSYSDFLTTDRICKYDLKVVTTTNNQYTLIRGNLQVLPPVTQI